VQLVDQRRELTQQRKQRRKRTSGRGWGTTKKDVIHSKHRQTLNFAGRRAISDAYNERIAEHAQLPIGHGHLCSRYEQMSRRLAQLHESRQVLAGEFNR
jgi:hypothetical protein